MSEKQRWTILGFGLSPSRSDSEPVEYPAPQICCPRGHRRAATRQEQTESVIWCEPCGQSYEIEWTEERT